MDANRDALINLGHTVYTKKLWWSVDSGDYVKKTYGFTGYVWHGVSLQCIVRRAHKHYKCRICGTAIAKGDLHASEDLNFVRDHFCLDCVTSVKPEDVYQENKPDGGEFCNPE